MAERAVVRFSSYEDALAWFTEHQYDNDAVFVPIAKKGGNVPTPTYDELVQIALIHGWIDGQKRGLDDDCYLLAFSPRRPGSPWSRINRVNDAKRADTRARRIAAFVDTFARGEKLH